MFIFPKCVKTIFSDSNANQQISTRTAFEDIQKNCNYVFTSCAQKLPSYFDRMNKLKSVLIKQRVGSIFYMILISRAVEILQVRNT